MQFTSLNGTIFNDNPEIFSLKSINDNMPKGHRAFLATSKDGKLLGYVIIDTSKSKIVYETQRYEDLAVHVDIMRMVEEETRSRPTRIRLL